MAKEEALNAISSWIPVTDKMPAAKQRVYIVCERPRYGGGVIQYQTMAEYIPYMAVLEEDYMSDEFAGDGDYDEEKDVYYAPEGWYEYQSEAEIYYRIDPEVVTHWMPLFELPESSINHPSKG